MLGVCSCPALASKLHHLSQESCRTPTYHMHNTRHVALLMQEFATDPSDVYLQSLEWFPVELQGQ